MCPDNAGGDGPAWMPAALRPSRSIPGSSRIVLRPMIGEPPFAVLMITIGLGFVLRAGAGAIWGGEPKNISSPLAGGVLKILVDVATDE